MFITTHKRKRMERIRTVIDIWMVEEKKNEGAGMTKSKSRPQPHKDAVAGSLKICA